MQPSMDKSRESSNNPKTKPYAIPPNIKWQQKYQALNNKHVDLTQ